jgi:predicted nucleic acid-binding Zn ribbon protein
MLCAQMADRQQQDDPWAKARAAQREDVAALFAPRERRCSTCGAEQRDGGRTCTNCGAELTAHYERVRARRPLMFAAIVAAVLVAVSVPIVAGLRDDADAERQRAAERQRERVAAERVRQERDARPVRARGPAPAAGEDALAHRERLVADAEAKITDDARERVAAGTLEGDIKGTECGPYPRTAARSAAERDPATAIGRYDCVAYTSKFDAPGANGEQRTGLFGHPYWLVVDYDRARFVWCKVTPRAGEGGSVLVTVAVPAPCRDPEGPG